jgi:hypothetical protein
MATVRRRLRDAVTALRGGPDDVRAQVAASHAQLRETTAHEVRHAEAQLHADLAQLRADLERRDDAIMTVLQALYDDEPGNRRRLTELRAQPEYERPFVAPDPLVSVCIPTYDNARGLAERSIPSALAQTHANVEVVIVGDAADSAIADAAQGFDDPRVRFHNLPLRGPYPDPEQDREAFWFVAGIPPMNAAMRLARGDWIAFLHDDDAFTPQFVEVLLSAARRDRLELAYGRIRRIAPDGEESLLGAFPPAPYDWGMQSALFHRGLRMFEFELLDAVFRSPGDWSWIRRMMRAGVRIGRVDEIVTDYYPGLLWADVDRE